MLSTFRDKFLLESAVFISGALVMIYEIIGSRILAPYIGTSTYVWTSLIGVILGALSLGYWLGGKMADRKPDTKILAIVLFVAGGLVTIAILLNPLILSAISEASTRLEIKSVLASLILFAPASVAFGFVTPYAIRLKLITIADSGKTVGRLYALSTVGSILGTFLAGFFLLPFVGSIRTLYIIAGILFLLSIVIAPFRLNVANLFLILLLPFSILLNEGIAYAAYLSHEMRDFDSAYSHLRVLKSEEKTTRRPVRALITDPHSSQSVMYLDGDDLALPYTRYYHLLRHVKPDFKQVLMIGGAAYSFPKDYLRVYPGRKLDVVEIDPQVTKIAREYFNLGDDPNLKIIHEDGRAFLNKAEAGKYDAVLVDAFGSVYSIPFQLTTKEAVSEMHRATTNDGVVILNIISAIEGTGSLFLQAAIKTYQEKFPNVTVFKPDPEKQADQRQNLILVASKRPLTATELGDPEIAAFLTNIYVEKIDLTVPILTDELAPVEYYVSLIQGIDQK